MKIYSADRCANRKRHFDICCAGIQMHLKLYDLRFEVYTVLMFITTCETEGVTTQITINKTRSISHQMKVTVMDEEVMWYV
jgi:hypothetical protein